MISVGPGRTLPSSGHKKEMRQDAAEPVVLFSNEPTTQQNNIKNDRKEGNIGSF